MDTSATSSILGATQSPPGAASGRGISELSSDDFFKLLVTQLTNQDPLQPTSNDEMLKQISSIREIELSSTLTDSLRKISGEQRGSSASSLIGQHVTGTAGADGTVPQGIVVGVRFTTAGPVLLLSSGTQVPLDQVGLVQSPEQAAASLVGQTVSGVDRRDPKNPAVIEGLVTAARVDEQKQLVLELDNGQTVRLADVAAVAIGASPEVAASA